MLTLHDLLIIVASTCLVRVLLFYLEIEIDNRYACYSIITVKIIIIRCESHIDFRTESVIMALAVGGPSLMTFQNSEKNIEFESL